MKSPALHLLAACDWGEFGGFIGELKAWPFYPELISTLENLKREALFQSPVHGEGHIERTILHGAAAAMDNHLDLRDTQLLLLACAYHDTGRLSDWLDDAHGRRSAYKLEALTGLRGDELAMVMAAVEAHSRRDEDMDEILASYHPAEPERCRRLALMLKDSDGLDRVRISDLDPSYLRLPAAAGHAGFARFLFDRYLEAMKELGLPVPDKKAYFDMSLVRRVRDMVKQQLDRGFSAMEIVSGCLSELTDSPPVETLTGHPCRADFADSSCAARQGASAFLADYCTRTGRDSGPVTEDFRSRFTEQYHSDCCRDLRSCGFHEGDSPYLCASFMLDVILFTYKFVSDGN